MHVCAAHHFNTRSICSPWPTLPLACASDATPASGSASLAVRAPQWEEYLAPFQSLGMCGARSVPNVGLQGWQVVIDQVTADTAALTADTCPNNATQPCITFLDTGNPGLALPSALYTQVASLTGALARTLNDFQALPSCSTAGLPTFAFHIGGRAFDLAPADYVFTVRARVMLHIDLRRVGQRSQQCSPRRLRMARMSARGTHACVLCRSTPQPRRPPA